MKSAKRVEIVGADSNNLASVDVEFRINALTAVVGVSGSGKSSLVDATLATEAAVRMRRFLDIDIGVSNQDVRAFVGELPPTVLVGQRAFRASSRTTVATSTSLLRELRRLFLRHGTLFSNELGEPVPAPSPSVFEAWLSSHLKGRAIVWAVPVHNEFTSGVNAAAKLLEAGLVDAVVYSENDRGGKAETGRAVRLDKFKPLHAGVRHSIEAKIGEVVLGAKTATRLLGLLERAWQAADGGVFVELPDVRRNDLRQAFTFGLNSRRHRVHPDSPHLFLAPSRHLLTFNSPEHEDSGACPVCDGRGTAAVLDEDALITSPEKSMHQGAFALWTEKNYRYVNVQHETIEGLRGRFGFDPDKPWNTLSIAARRMILDGTPDPVTDLDPRTRKKVSKPHNFLGFRAGILERAGRTTQVGEALKAFIRIGPCSACQGTRWNSAARAIRVDGISIDEVLARPFSVLSESAGKTTSNSEVMPNSEVERRWANVKRTGESFVKLGLGALSGERGMLEVSDGESRRTRFAGVLNSRLAGLLLVLDEPGRGLHEADLARIGDAIIGATARHTVVMSEHRPLLVARADDIIEMGPGAGKHGGNVVRTGPATRIKLPNLAAVEYAITKPKPRPKWIEISGVNVHNVVDATVRLPLGLLTCIAGVSGSGKSSFVRGALVPALMRELPKEAQDVDEFRTCAATWRKFDGAKSIGALHALDQTPSLAHRRSLVVTFMGVADSLRRAFAAAPQAKILGLEPGDFSTNSGLGRCQKCLGTGTAEDGGPCPVCGGLRFGINVLSVRIDGRNLAEVLALPIGELTKQAPAGVDEAAIRHLVELGLGHLSLGRSLDSLSGGEIQRLRIARALCRHRSRGAVFVIDEPACGLHPNDVERLYRALRHIVADGENTVILVEHDLYLLARCDHIVEFGPCGGPGGGKVIAEGLPTKIASMATPTGLALAGKVGGSGARHPKPEPISAATSLAIANVARSEIRQIIGDDVDVSDVGSIVRPAATIKQPSEFSRPMDLADLDRAVAGILLDTMPSAKTAIQGLSKKWNDHPTATLRIHPFLDSIAMWGPNVPKSEILSVNRHLVAMGLTLVRRNASPLEARATGKRLIVEANCSEARDAAIHDAWALGNGYVELADEAGGVIYVANDRLLDLSGGLIGPRRPRVAHFSRRDSLGRCPECNGSGSIYSVDSGLLVSPHGGGVFDDSFLEGGAATVLRGVRRSEMLPFFRRLTAEGLWADRPWSQMSEEERQILLYGYWIRPGYGTFLKSGSNNIGSDVRHWLRWDGLVPAVLAQLERCNDAAWRSRVESSRELVVCPLCKGSGLAKHSHLLRLGDLSLGTWALRGTVEELVDALKGLVHLPPRAVRARDRVVSCLHPLLNGPVPLRTPLGPTDAHRVLALASAAFVGLPLADE